MQKDPPPHEPDYSSIEELFCLPVTESKDKGAAAPIKKEPKEVCFVYDGQHSDLKELNYGIYAFLFCFLF